MKKPDEMNTLVSVINRLTRKNFGNEFRMDEKGFICQNNGKYYKPEELEIIKTYRFEGDSDPGDSSILYVIRVVEDGLIGYCIDVYGAYSNSTKFEEFIRKIPVHREEEDAFFEVTGEHSDEESNPEMKNNKILS